MVWCVDYTYAGFTHLYNRLKRFQIRISQYFIGAIQYKSFSGKFSFSNSNPSLDHKATLLCRVRARPKRGTDILQPRCQVVGRWRVGTVRQLSESPLGSRMQALYAPNNRLSLYVFTLWYRRLFPLITFFRIISGLLK
jgi:hypothetical protein